MPELIGLDFETYGATSLPKHGLYRYTECETFRPLIGSVAFKYSSRRYGKHRFDFVNDRRAATRELRDDFLTGKSICAHNAIFEERVLDVLGIKTSALRFIDSAVISRAAGAGAGLEAAAPQLLGIDKIAQGKQLIKLFSIPGKYQEASGDPHFDPQVIVDNPIQWEEFGYYCDLDAELSLKIVEGYQSWVTRRELGYQALTMEMNQRGWPVDTDLVEEMQRRYLENQEQALFEFRRDHNALDLNLNSLKQLKEWCLERGIKATSFDEKHVEKLMGRIMQKLETDAGLPPGKVQNYSEVLALLETKQILGGASLKKLQTILDTVGEDRRLKDQYIHCGAGQTLRTTGRSVQMQNLKRLGADVADMEELEDPDTEWDNGKLAKNIRQVFTASEEKGRLIVGDFSSVESRGLAYLAGAKWKLDAFRQGKDLYKVLASSPEMFGVPYDDVTKEQRQSGKVGELSCGYGAGAGAVQQFAESMGIGMEEAEAASLVRSWRATNPEVVEFWALLDLMLHRAVESGVTGGQLLPDGMYLVIEPVATPDSLLEQHPGASSIRLAVYDNQGGEFLIRYFHGCYIRGRDICYYKPSDRKTGDLWRSHFIHPKTKQLTFYKIYGGKLAGILTQSFCRELFFRSLEQVSQWCGRWSDSVQLVGQFHDEIVVDWRPGGGLSLEKAKEDLERMMSDPGIVSSFPLAAEIKDDYRYTK